ncbi:MAG: ATP-binding cassette domain-containing protein [Gemmatimonadaceae bacterium]|nr:ATP-binding cassette domain-containing protein [Gemmatimonadaceae bacterium]
MSHRYAAVVALQSVSVQIAPGTLLALVGESGSGKTTLLRCFNRMVQPDSGTVAIDGQDVRVVDPVALRRRIGYVPQTGGLLPHWSVLRNVSLVPQLTRHPDPAQAAREALERCGLSASVFGARFPHELSGGQRQRVALARALAASQRVLLLDESFGALDAISRDELHEAFVELKTTVGFTAILVTHDIAEAARLADGIAVMRAGRIEQQGALGTLLAAPATPYVAQLLARAQASARRLVAP